MGGTKCAALSALRETIRTWESGPSPRRATPLLGAPLPGRLSHGRSERVQRSLGLSHQDVRPVAQLVARLHQVSHRLARCLCPMSD
jgi:hypothetical protein